MARLNSQPVRAFTAGFDSPDAADEREHAAAVAKAVGAKHESIEVTEAMVWGHLPEIVGCMDDPAADYAIIPTWFLARRAHEEVKVVLTGEGGDEIFAGYDRYRKAIRPWWRGGRTIWARGSFDKVPVLRVQPTTWRDGMAVAEAQALENGGSRLAAAQETDMADWLPHDLLLKAGPLPDGARGRGADAVSGQRRRRGGVPAAGWDESARRSREVDPAQVAGEELADGGPFAPKQGFTVPVGAWIKGRGDAWAAGRTATGDRGDRASGSGGGVVPRHPPLAARLRVLEIAVLRVVAPAAYSGPGAGGRCVRDVVGTRIVRQAPIARRRGSGYASDNLSF